MRVWLCCVLTVAACTPGDDTADGARAQCGEGGALTDCADSARTPEGACWRLVDCGAIPLHHDETFRSDWNRCVEEIWDAPTVQQSLIVACVAASTCDQLKSDSDRCFAYGEN